MEGEAALLVACLEFEKSPMGEFELFIISWQQGSIGGKSPLIPSKAVTKLTANYAFAIKTDGTPLEISVSGKMRNSPAERKGRLWSTWAAIVLRSRS
jgi:hypothetical protein